MPHASGKLTPVAVGHLRCGSASQDHARTRVVQGGATAENSGGAPGGGNVLAAACAVEKGQQIQGPSCLRDVTGRGSIRGRVYLDPARASRTPKSP